MPRPRSKGPGGSDLLSLGLLLAVAVVLPTLIGITLDRELGTGPAFLLVGLIIGIVAAVAAIYLRYIRRYM
ncbi:MAG: AtpZ/AtpI family protein [Candidatus Dormibacteraceae bacterium]